MVFVNSTQITCLTPAGPSSGGSVNVQLNNPDGGITTLTNGFTYLGVTSVSPNTGGTAGGTTVTINGTGFVSGGAVSFGGTPGTSVTFISSTQIQAVTPAHAAGAVNVVVTNPSGATGTLTNGFTYTSQPAITSVSPNSGSTAGGTTVTINGSNFQSGVTVKFGANSAASLTLVNSAQLTAVSPAGAAGAVNVVVTNPGPVSATLTNGFTYSNAPVVTGISPGSGTTSGGTPVTISGSNFLSGATVSIGGTAATSVVFVNSAQLTAVTPAHAAGAVNVVVTNPGGLSSTLTNGYTYVAGLAVTAINPITGPTSGGTAVTISGSGFLSGAQVHFVSPASPSGTAATSVVIVSPTQLTAVTPASVADSSDVRVTNPGGATATMLDGFTYVSNLTVTSVAPASGTTAGGTPVTINGTGFLSGPTVSLGGVNATSVVFVSAIKLTAVTPAHVSGPVEVRVTNAISGDTFALPNGFTYTAPPVVTSVAPANGSPAGGNVVTINGSAFGNGATATFGGTAATGVTFISSTQLQATTPAHTAGAVTVQVTNPNTQSGSKANAFTYNAAMSVTSVSPAGGISGGGETVTVSGSGFQTNTTVFFDQDSAQQVTLVSSTQIQALTPPHNTGVVDINVSTPDSQFDALAGAFEYSTGKSQTSTPTPASVSPNSGAQIGGTAVTITGTNFVSGLTVTFDGVAATAINVVSGGQITCNTPAHAAGAVDIVVTNPDGGSGTLPSSYNYLGLDLVTISPTAASIAGGTVITLNGSGFQNGASVLMGGLLAATTFVNSDQLQATAPAHVAGVVDVKITNPDTVNDTLPASLTYANLPAISKLIPDSGLNTGGTTVIIQGIGFQSGATVTFGSLPATSVTFVSGSEVRAVTPAQAIGAVDVKVNNPDGGIATRTNGFRYGQVFFQDGFESGSLSNFNYFQTADRVAVNTNPAFVRSGTKSVQIRYDVCGDSTNLACGAAHQDKNRYVSKDILPGLQRFNLRGYFYIKTPEPGASPEMSRKLLYIRAATGPGGTPNSLWYLVVGVDTAKNGLRVSYSPQSGISPTVTFYGFDSELPNKSTLVNGMFEFQFDRWYSLEVEVQSKSGLGASDSFIRMYVDGNLVFKKTVFSDTVNCPGRTYKCIPFPVDAVFGNNIKRWEIGNQADRVNYLVMDELRFWDDIVIADAYIGP